MKKALQLTVGIAFSALFLWLAFRKSDLTQVMAILRGTRVELVLFSLAISVVALFVRSYRWKLLGARYAGVPYRHFFRATTMGLMLNTFLPFRTGDLFQGYFISRTSKLPQSYTLSTVFMERMTDFISPALMLVIGSLFIALPAQISLPRLAVIFAVVVSVITAVIVMRGKFVAFLSRFLHERHSATVARLLDNMVTALGFFRDRQFLTRVLPLTMGTWFILSAASTFLILKSLAIPITFFQAYLVLSVSVMSVAIPSSPGFVGTWEFFCVLALSIFGIDRERALSYALLSHVLNFLPTVAFGLYFLIQEYVFKHILHRTSPSS